MLPGEVTCLGLEGGAGLGQEEKGTTDDEMAGWHHWLDGRESQWTPGVGDRQGDLECCNSWGRKESDTTEQLIWSDLIVLYALIIIIPALLSFLSTSIQNTGILSFFSLLSEEVSSKKSTYGMLIFHAARFLGVLGVFTASIGESSSITTIPSSIWKKKNQKKS